MKHRFRHLLDDAPPETTTTFTYDNEGRLVEQRHGPRLDDIKLNFCRWYDPTPGRWLDEEPIDGDE